VKKTGLAETRISRKARTARHQDVYDLLLKRLIAAREELGLTQHQVSALMNRPPNFLTRCEGGDRSIDVMELFELAKIYKKPISFFFPRR
jgi:transcriptional regulator with XRE-family HTH domain